MSEMLTKSFIESLRIAQNSLSREGRTADADRVQGVLNVLERMRPTGNDGKHGVKHTLECGCEDVSLRDNMIMLALSYVESGVETAKLSDTPEDKFYGFSTPVLMAADILRQVDKDFEND